MLDNYFSEELSKDDVKKLISELQELISDA